MKANKWKIGFFVILALLLIVSFLLLKSETKNAFNTVRNSLTTSYITSDISILNKIITTNCRIKKSELLLILQKEKTDLVLDSIDSKMYFNGCELIFNDNDELDKIMPLN